MKVYTFKQRTVEWYQKKWGKASSTGIKELMVSSKKPDETRLFLKLLMELNEPYNDAVENGYVNGDMQRGIEMEPYGINAVISELEYQEGIAWIDVGFIESCKHELLGLSPDKVSMCYTEAIEVKCPTGMEHIRWMYQDDIIPSEHVWQAVNYFAVIDDLKKLHWASYRPENKLKSLYLVTLTRDSNINIGTLKTPKIVTVEKAVSIMIKKYNEMMCLIKNWIELHNE